MNTRGKKNERGATAVEYGLIVAAFAALVILVAGLVPILVATFDQASCNEDLGYHCTP